MLIFHTRFSVVILSLITLNRKVELKLNILMVWSKNYSYGYISLNDAAEAKVSFKKFENSTGNS